MVIIVITIDQNKNPSERIVITRMVIKNAGV
jgi:hypothetical protein